MSKITARLSEMQALLNLYDNIVSDLQIVSTSIERISNDCSSTWRGTAQGVFAENAGNVMQQVNQETAAIERCKGVLQRTIADYTALEVQNTQEIQNATSAFSDINW